MSEDSLTRHRGGWRLATIGFPMVLWFIAMFFLLGDLGVLNDDWAYIQRVPETGAVRALVFDRPIHFWRPLYRVIVPAMATLLWHQEWINHLILVLVHGLNAWLVWKFLGMLGVREMAAAISALAFMVAPWHFEVVFWICNVPTSLSTATMLGAMLVAIRWARGSVGWWIVPFAAVATFTSACLNEQPTMMIGALPCVALCARRGPFTRRMLVRSFAAGAAGGVTMAVYTKLHLTMVGPGFDIGGAHGVLPLARWPGSAGRTITWVWRFLMSGDWHQRAWQCAWVVFKEFQFRSALAGGAALICGTLWVRHMSRHGHEQAAAQRDRTARPGQLALLGAAIIVLTTVPVVVFDYWRMPRMLYAPAVGVFVLLASVFGAVADRSPKPLSGLIRSRAVIGGFAAVLLVAQAVSMVGVQEGYRRRDRMDREALAELVAQAPDPDAHAVLVPVWMAFPDVKASAARFEGYYWAVFASWWSSEFAIRLAYQRSDLRGGHAGWGRSGLSKPSSTSVIVAGVGNVEWARIVPFTFDPAGHVHLVTHVRFVENGQAREVALPQVARFVGTGTAVPSTYVFPEGTR